LYWNNLPFCIIYFRAANLFYLAAFFLVVLIWSELWYKYKAADESLATENEKEFVLSSKSRTGFFIAVMSGLGVLEVAVSFLSGDTFTMAFHVEVGIIATIYFGLTLGLCTYGYRMQKMLNSQPDEDGDAFVISRRTLRIKLAVSSIVCAVFFTLRNGVLIPLLLGLPLGPDASSVLYPYVILLFFVDTSAE
jgi:hypothetical protein